MHSLLHIVNVCVYACIGVVVEVRSQLCGWWLYFGFYWGEEAGWVGLGSMFSA